MAAEPTPSGTPDELLSASRELARRVRTAQRAAWFPLLLLAVLFLYPTGSFVYWPIALLLASVVIAAYYYRRSNRRGLGSRVRPYVVAGVVLAVVFTAVSLWGVHHPPIGPHEILGLRLAAGSKTTLFLYRLFSPASAVGFGLLVLAWVERNRMLAMFSAGYLAIVLWPVDFGWVVARPSSWAFLPHLVVPAGALLLAGLAFGAAQRPATGSRPVP